MPSMTHSTRYRSRRYACASEARRLTVLCTHFPKNGTARKPFSALGTTETRFSQILQIFMLDVQGNVVLHS